MSFLDADASTDVDELAASLGVRYPSPAGKRQRHENSYLPSTPLANRSPNVRRPIITSKSKQLNLDVTPSLLRGASPAKSMFFEPEEGARSPYRIKVTVEAEPRDGSPSPKKAAASKGTRVTRVPLKGGDDETPARGKGKGRKGTPTAAAKRKGTPIRRRSGRNSAGRGKSVHVNVGEEQDETPKPELQPVKRRQGRPRKARKATLDEDSLLDMIADQSTVEPEIPIEYEQAGHSVPDIEEIQDPGIEENMAQKYPPDQAEQEDQDQDLEDDVDFVHIDDYGTGAQSDNDDDVYEQDLAQTNITGAPIAPAPQHRATPPVPQSRLQTTRDHFQHGMFSPLLPRQPLNRSPAKSPAPFSKRMSSPATEADAEMWRGQTRRQSSKWEWQGDHDANEESEAEDEDRNYDEVEDEVPDLTAQTVNMTARTIGENTMMQSEDFSIVSLSSLPSSKVNSSMLGHSERSVDQSRLDQSQIDRSLVSARKPSRLHKAVTFSSPLAQSTHTYENGNDDESLLDDEQEEDEAGSDSDDDAGVNRPLPPQQPQAPTPQQLSCANPTQAHASNSFLEEIGDALATPVGYNNKANMLGGKYDILYEGADIHRARWQTRQTPATQFETSVNRLPTPLSNENSQDSPVGHVHISQIHNHNLNYKNMDDDADITYPQVDTSTYPQPQLESSPSQAKREPQMSMSSPPATPPPRHDSPRVRQLREVSLQSSGGVSASSRRSWVDEPKSERMIALEEKWQRERENVKRSFEQMRGGIVTIAEDEDGDEDEDEDEDDEDGDELRREASELAKEADAMYRRESGRMEDVWQDISTSYDGGASQVSRKERVTHMRPKEAERPVKIARTETRQSPGARASSSSEEPVRTVTPQKSYEAERNIASVKRREKVSTDVSALFRGLNGGPSFTARGPSPAKPSPLRQAYDGTFDETDIDLSDVRQIRNEMRNAAQRRPPFPSMSRGTTTTVPTKLKSIDDTMTTQDEDEDVEMEDETGGERPQSRDESFVSFTGQARPSRALFNAYDSGGAVRVKKEPAREASASSSSSGEGILTSLWRTLTFTHPYIPPPRPIHPLLSSPHSYPLLPSTFAWSHTHWSVLDTLYQAYKRHPSRFTPTYKRRWNNTQLMTPHWRKYVDITFEHWGYRVRLEESHIILAILYSQLLVLPSESEYRKLYGEGLNWRDQDPSERRGERIAEWDVLLNLFAVVAGEMLREDEREGRRVKRELVGFRFRLSGELGWRAVTEEAPF